MKKLEEGGTFSKTAPDSKLRVLRETLKGNSVRQNLQGDLYTGKYSEPVPTTKLEDAYRVDSPAPKKVEIPQVKAVPVNLNPTNNKIRIVEPKPTNIAPETVVAKKASPSVINNSVRLPTKVETKPTTVTPTKAKAIDETVVDKPGIMETLGGISNGIGRYIDKKIASVESDWHPNKDDIKFEKPVEIKKSSSYAGYQRLGTAVDSKSGKQLHSFTNEFDNKAGGTYKVLPKMREMGTDRTVGGVEGVAHFIMDGDITPNQKFNKPYVDSKQVLHNSDVPGKFIQGKITNPEQYVMQYKQSGDTHQIRYKKVKDIKEYNPSKGDYVDNEGFTGDVRVRSHSFSDIDWEGKGKDTGYKAKSEYLPLKSGGYSSIVNTQSGRYDRFSGGSGIYVFTDKEGHQRGIDVGGSTKVMKKVGEDIVKKYNISPDKLDFLYHDMGSYSAKPMADSQGKLSTSQWRDFNTYNRGYSGAAIVIPKRRLAMGGYLNKKSKYLPKKADGGYANIAASKQTAKDATAAAVSAIPVYGQILGPLLKVQDKILGKMGENDDGTLKKGFGAGLANVSNGLGGASDLFTGDFNSFLKRSTFGLLGGKTKAEYAAEEAKKKMLAATVTEGTEDFNKDVSAGYNIKGNADANMFAKGGSIKRGKLTQYVGDKHEAPSGGIPVNSSGTPSNRKPVAMVEGGETMYNYRGEPVVFSDRVSPINGATFADLSRRMKNDGTGLNNLAKLQVSLSDGDPVKARGGGLKALFKKAGIGRFEAPKVSGDENFNAPISKAADLSKPWQIPMVGGPNNVPSIKFRTDDPAGTLLDTASRVGNVAPLQNTGVRQIPVTNSLVDKPNYNDNPNKVDADKLKYSIGDKVAAVSGDVSNILLAGNLKAGAKQKHQSIVRANLVNNNQELRDINDATRTTQMNLRASGGQNTAADRIAAGAAGIGARSRSYAEMNNTNAGILNQNALTNSQIQANNNGIDTYNENQDIELNNKKQQIYSQAFGNISNTLQGMSRDNKLFGLDKEKFGILQKGDKSGVLDRSGIQLAKGGILKKYIKRY